MTTIVIVSDYEQENTSGLKEILFALFKNIGEAFACAGCIWVTGRTLHHLRTDEQMSWLSPSDRQILDGEVENRSSNEANTRVRQVSLRKAVRTGAEMNCDKVSKYY